MVSFQDARDKWMEVVKAKEVSSTEGRKSYFPSEEPGFCPMPSSSRHSCKNQQFYSVFGILFGIRNFTPAFYSEFLETEKKNTNKQQLTHTHTHSLTHSHTHIHTHTHTITTNNNKID